MRILINGGGKMGRALADIIESSDDLWLLAMLDSQNAAELEELPGAGVVIDFSHPDALPGLYRYVARTGTPLVCGTTGLSGAEMDLLRSMGRLAPVLYSANYSLGIAVLRRLLPGVQAALGQGFDIELVESHHREKADAPSGTAKLLLHALDPAGDYNPVTGQRAGRRRQGEIGIHSIRGGSIAGEHTVHFLGAGESLTISHAAANRSIFAQGAMRAARRLATRPPGLYSLDDILFGEEAEAWTQLRSSG